MSPNLQCPFGSLLSPLSLSFPGTLHVNVGKTAFLHGTFQLLLDASSYLSIDAINARGTESFADVSSGIGATLVLHT